MPVKCELRTLRKFEDITYEPSREEAAPYPSPGQDRTGQDSYSQTCLPVCLLACLPTPQGRGGARFECIGEIQVQSYRGTEIQVEGGKP